MEYARIHPYSFKAIVVGDTGVGKSAALEEYFNSKPYDKSSNSLKPSAVTYYSKNFCLYEQDVRLDVTEMGQSMLALEKLFPNTPLS